LMLIAYSAVAISAGRKATADDRSLHDVTDRQAIRKRHLAQKRKDIPKKYALQDKGLPVTLKAD